MKKYFLIVFLFVGNFLFSQEVKDSLTTDKPCPISIKYCPEKHVNNIIPIIYGFPNQKMLKKSKKGKIKLGGCNPSKCEKWYCKKHNLSF